MSRQLRILTFLAFVLGVVAFAPAASAQDYHTFTVFGGAGFGGSLDADPGDGIDHTSWQVGAAMVTEPRTMVGVRIGQIGFGGDEPLESLFDADLTYLTLGGEYKFDQTYYEAGMYLAVGGYQLEGTEAGGADRDDTSFGLALGVTGEFPITRRFGVLVEFSGHYTDLDAAQFFAMGHAGVAVHF